MIDRMDAREEDPGDDETEHRREGQYPESSTEPRPERHEENRQRRNRRLFDQYRQSCRHEHEKWRTQEALRTIHRDKARQRQRQQRQDGAFHHDLRAAENEKRRRQQDDELPDEVAPRVRGLPREPGHSQDIDDRVEHVEADRAQPIRPLRQDLVHEKIEEIENVRLAGFGCIAQWRPNGPGDVQGLVVMNADVPKQHRSKDSETARAGHQARDESWAHLGSPRQRMNHRGLAGGPSSIRKCHYPPKKIESFRLSAEPGG